MTSFSTTVSLALVVGVGLVTAAPNLNHPDRTLGRRGTRQLQAQDKSFKSNGDRVVNGWDATPGAFPWAVNFDLRSEATDGTQRQHLCGGTLIAPDIVMTAAHCFSKSDGSYQEYVSMTVHVGLIHRVNKEQNSQPYHTRTVSCVHRHEDFNPLDYTKDIALVKLDSPIEGVEMPVVADSFAGQDYYPPQYNSEAIGKLDLIGWGSINAWAPDDDTVEFEYPDVLQHGQINLLPNRVCIKPNGPYDAAEVTAKTLCGDTGDGVTGTDACIGDSGMPIFYRNNEGGAIIVGIVSSGIGCAASGYPGLYTKTAGFTSWVANAITALEMCTEGGDGNNNVASSEVGITRGNCRCAYVWAVNDGTCQDGETNYHYCGMNPSCDGDDLGSPGSWSWCFLDEESKTDPDCHSPGANWDYCEIGVGFCQENEYASAGSCHPCIPGTTRGGGDNPKMLYQFNSQFVATTCTVTVCGINQYVSNHVCTQCTGSLVRPAGDYANGADTECVTPSTLPPTPPPPTSPPPTNPPPTSPPTNPPAVVETGGGGAGCAAPADPLSNFNFLGNARLKGSKNYWLQSHKATIDADTGAVTWSLGVEVPDLTTCARLCIEAGNACLAFEMNDRRTALQCSLLTTGSTKVGGLGAPKGTWYAYDKTTFCGDYVQTTEEPQTMPTCPATALEYFGRGYMKRLKKTYLYTIGGTGSYGGGRLRLNLEGCAQACIDHGPECRSVEFKMNPKCDLGDGEGAGVPDCGKCELKIYNMLDTAIKDNTGGWLIRSKELFECI